MKKLLYLLLLVSNIVCAKIDVNTYIPPEAYKYFGIIKKESDRLIPEFIYPYYFAALIEHESCVSLTSRQCWKPTSTLRTSRELGVGLGQITKTYGKRGFDNLTSLRNTYWKELHELSWSNVASRPDLQIRAIILMYLNNNDHLNTAIDNPYQRMAMLDAGYNGGLGGVLKDRRVCGLAKNCNPHIWFNNTEKYCTKSKKVLYGQRNACMINRNHVRDVLKTRLKKYRDAFED